MHTPTMETGGAYTADRAAALSGVPRSTVHYWARKGIVEPSASPERVKLWSYADLLTLRTVYWLRQRKATAAGREVPPTAMSHVRRARAQLRELDLDLFHAGRPTVLVDASGALHVRPPGEPTRDLGGQTIADDMLDLLAPFDTREHTRGVDLQRPSEFVRIFPRKLSGSPHVVDTRIDTEGLAALERRGFDVERIARLYPDLGEAEIRDALTLEESLRKNLAA